MKAPWYKRWWIWCAATVTAVLGIVALVFRGRKQAMGLEAGRGLERADAMADDAADLRADVEAADGRHEAEDEADIRRARDAARVLPVPPEDDGDDAPVNGRRVRSRFADDLGVD